jgi:hypothetical protein
MSRFQRKGEDEAETSTTELQQLDSCPYCHAPVKSGIKFCIKCNHQLTGPIGQYSPTRPGKNDGGQGKGFSSKAKVATSKSNSLSQIQKVLTLVLIILVGYGGWTALHNDELMTTLSKLVANVDKK